MPVNKIYYTDPYLQDTKTKICATKNSEKGHWYSFTETIFYPEGGGQAADLGWINQYPLLDVQVFEGEVWHLLEKEIVNPVDMKLDWDFRYENMRQHSGQHILSACFKKYHNLDTLAVHLGREITLIELDIRQIDSNILEETESRVNQVVRENIPIEANWISGDQLESFDLRRHLKTNDKNVRLISIGSLDCVGCGGLHVKSTGEVGLIKIIGVETIRKHIRVKIKIGAAAYKYFNKLHSTLQFVGNNLTTSIEDLPDKIVLLAEENRNLARSLKKSNQLWLTEYAKNLSSSIYPGCFHLSGFSKDQLNMLTECFLKIHEIPCFIVSEENNRLIFCIRLPKKMNYSVRDFIVEPDIRDALKGGGGDDFAAGIISQGDMIDTVFQNFHNFVKEREEY